MFNNPLYAKECIYSINFLNMLTVVLIKNFKEEIFEEISNVRCNGNKLNPEIFDFFKRMGGTKKVYDYFSDSYTPKNKHIKYIWHYCNKYRVQPYRLRMSTDFTIIQIPVFFEYTPREVA